MSAVYKDILYWGCLGMVNLGISVLVYHSTKAEQKQKMTPESELSTRPNSKPTASLPSSFIFLSVMTGLLNFGGAFFRSRHIHLLEIPTTWLTKCASDAGDSTLLAQVIEAEWIVAVNDWGSLFLTFAFFLAGCFNFATVRQLRLRAREEKQRLLPITAEKGCIVGFEGVVDERPFFLGEKQQVSGEDS